MDSTGNDQFVSGGEPFSHREEHREESQQHHLQDEHDDFQHHHNSQALSGDGASPGKIFIGGLARDTTIAQFVKHFSKYGEITDSVIMKDRKTGQPRGFGFITYADPSVVDKVIEDNHVINGKQVEIKRTIPRGAVGSKDFRTKKIFVGGIPSTVTEDEFRDFFTRYGEVKDHQIMRDHSTNRSRGFGFITFDAEDAVDDLLSMGNRIEFAGAQVEIKKAEPKKPNPPAASSKRYNDSRSSYGSGYGDSYDGFGGGSFGVGSYRSGGMYGGRSAAYGGYGSEFGGYGGYGGAMGPYRGDPSLGYAGRYGGGGFGRGYDLGGYGGPSESYGAYGGGAGTGGSSGAGAYQSGYGASLGGGYGGGASGGSFYGSRGGYGAGRYHPYGR